MNKELKLPIWAALIIFVCDCVIAWFGFDILTTWNLVLWQQIFIGIITFIFTVNALQLALAVVLAFIMAIKLYHDIKNELEEDYDDYGDYDDFDDYDSYDGSDEIEKYINPDSGLRFVKISELDEDKEDDEIEEEEEEEDEAI